MNKIIETAASSIASVIIVFLFSVSSYAEQLAPDIQFAKEKGIVLYNQYKAISAEPYLEMAARSGDRESQYYLGESIRFNKRFMTPEAEKWYTAAAEQGDIYAMYRLAGNSSDLCTVMKNCPKGSRTAAQWFELGKQAAKLKADGGDAEAMYLLYFFRGGDEWLMKSAEAGFPEANDYLATLYSDGRKFYFPPWRRSERIAELFKVAAQGGYPPAMMKISGILLEKKDMAGARFWVEKAAASGYETGVTSLGAYTAHVPDGMDFPLDRIKGYALISLLLELNGGGNVIGYAERKLKEISSHLSEEQIEEAKKVAQEWKATHPPLSFFPDKLGY
ncbi:tetratricopeptide repeat protein [Pseudomonas nicosulfuronedens]